MSPVVTLALKDLRLLSRDWFALFWILFFPVLFALFFGTIFAGGGERGMSPLPVAVVDRDGSPRSREFVEALRKNGGLDVTTPKTEEEARAAVRQGRLVAFVLVKPGFGAAPHAGFGKDSLLEMGIDPRRQAEAGVLQGLLASALFPTGPERGAPGPPRIPQTAVTREGRKGPSSFEITFPSAVLWGVIGCTAAFAISIVTERVGGTFLRLRVAPLSVGQLLAGKSLACFLACATVAVFLLALGALAFGVRLTDPAGLVVALACMGCCFVGITMLLATIGKTEQAVAGAGWGILMVMAMIGGGMIPLFFMPSWMQAASSISPVKWGILALEGASWRGFSWAEMALPCGILVAVGVACFALGVRFLSRKEA